MVEIFRHTGTVWLPYESTIVRNLVYVLGLKVTIKYEKALTNSFYRNFILNVICIFSHILCMYVLSASTNHILNSSHVYVFKKIMNIILPCKVQIFWEGLKKFEKNLPLIFWSYFVTSKQHKIFFHIFEAFSENLNFTK